ncbi:HD-GYP domain-containing protein [Rugamonas sp. DEMB1]|uniref:HD-GYP domain-containing protein n=1 Tax=Rugamonas sp. DEMB1 TaxID=3039386 RepID=UPI002446802B|nr:HD-GYP domain-containing protein [Rugamonas sp. DEMB1]WGG48233.1 HD-GYP domain-containing protein [Rugamonas sp. DEMB1]
MDRPGQVLDVADPAAPPTPAPAPPAARSNGEPARAARARLAAAPADAALATRLIARSKAAVAAVFAEARSGNMSSCAGVLALVDEIGASVLRNQDALLQLVRLRTIDDYTYIHSIAVCAMMVALAKQLGLDEARVRDCGLAGLFHDLGKMDIPPEILHKPARLTPAEFDIVKRHPEFGHRVLAGIGDLPPLVLDVCLHHHEKIDGSGYPERLRGAEISLYARMAAVCDVYDAVTSYRPYKAAWTPLEALDSMAQWCLDGHLDAAVFAAFVQCLGLHRPVAVAGADAQPG